MLPGSSKKKSFTDYFITPHNLNIAEIVKSFGLNHHLVKSGEDLKKKIKISIRNKSFTVLEIKSDGTNSMSFRKGFWMSAIKKIDKEFAAK